MDIQAEKISHIQWLAKLTDECVITRLKAIRQEKSDWWDEISEKKKNRLKLG